MKPARRKPAAWPFLTPALKIQAAAANLFIENAI
jgi:hypothetical protein